MALLLSPTSLQQRIKILNTIICLGIKYAFYAIPFFVLNIHKLDKHLIKLTKSIYNILRDSPNILTQLPQDAFEIGVFSLLPQYASTLSEQVTQTLNTHPSLLR